MPREAGRDVSRLRRRGIAERGVASRDVALALLVLAIAACITLPALAFNGGAVSTTNTLVNGTTSITATGVTENNEQIDRVTFTLPANSLLTGVTAASVTAVRVTAAGVTEPVPITSVTIDAVNRIVDVQMNFPRDRPAETFRVTVAGITNPSQPGSYTYAARIYGKGAPRTATAATALGPNASAVSVGAPTLSASLEGTIAAYSIPFQVGPRGRLGTDAQPGGVVTPNTVSVTFPAGYTLPVSPPAGSVTINGLPATFAISGQTVTITMPTAIPANGSGTIAFSSAFGIVNPIGGTYSMQVRTSAESGAGISPAFTIVPVPTRLTVTSASRPPAATLEQDWVAAVDAFTLQRTQGLSTVTVSAVQVTDSGPEPWVNIAGVQVYRDNGDGVYNAAGDTLLNASPATFAVGQSQTTVTFGAPELPGALPARYWVVYTVGPNPTDNVTATSRITGVTSNAAILDNQATTGSVFTIRFVVRLSLTIAPDAIGYGAIEPDIPTPPQSISVEVSSTYAYSISRTVSGDMAEMGFTISGTALGLKPKGLGTWADTIGVNLPWTTPADVPLAVDIQYSIVQQ